MKLEQFTGQEWHDDGLGIVFSTVMGPNGLFQLSVHYHCGRWMAMVNGNYVTDGGGATKHWDSPEEAADAAIREVVAAVNHIVTFVFGRPSVKWPKELR